MKMLESSDDVHELLTKVHARMVLNLLDKNVKVKPNLKDVTDVVLKEGLKDENVLEMRLIEKMDYKNKLKEIANGKEFTDEIKIAA